MGNKSTKNQPQVPSDKAVSKLLNSKRFQEIWNKIRASGIQPLYDAVQQAETSNSKTIKIAQNQIVSTYDIIVDLPQDITLRAALYQKYEIELEEYFNNKYIPLFKQIKDKNDDSHLVNEFCKHWIYASTVSRTMAQMFRYLDRYYVEKQSFKSIPIKTMCAQAYHIYYNIIHPYINDISTIILACTETYRESGKSELISGLTVVSVSDAINIFIHIDKELKQNIYYVNLHNKVLTDIQTFYSNTFTQKYWQDKCVPDCMTECKMYEERENKLFRKCLKGTAYYKEIQTELKKYLFDSMITNKWPILLYDIMHKKFKNIEISKQDSKSLAQLHNWMNLSGKKELTWEPYMQKFVGKMWVQCQSKFYIETVIYGLGRDSLNDENKNVPADIVAICMRYYDPKWIVLHLFIFVREMLLELYHNVNVNTNHVVKIQMVEINSVIVDIYNRWSKWNAPLPTMVAQYINSLFYLSNVSESGIKHKLNYISQFLIFLNGMKVQFNREINAFISEYMKLISYRLLSDQQNIKLEELLIKEFENMNIDILQTISQQSKALLKDVTKSNALCKEFYENKENDMLQSMEFNAMLCPTLNGGWKYLNNILIGNKPGCIEVACLKYSKFCNNNNKTKHNNHFRKIDFVLNYGYGEIEIEFHNNIKKIFIASTVMILIFEAFNFKDKYKMKYFQTLCKNSRDVTIIEENLAFLTTFGLLLETKEEEKKDGDIYWSINENFEFPTNRINLYHMFEVYKNNNTVAKFDERSQGHIVDACVVRTMKKKRSMVGVALIEHVEKELSTLFRATNEYINKRIKVLIELEYMKVESRAYNEVWYVYIP